MFVWHFLRLQTVDRKRPLKHKAHGSCQMHPQEETDMLGQPYHLFDLNLPTPAWQGVRTVKPLRSLASHQPLPCSFPPPPRPRPLPPPPPYPDQNSTKFFLFNHSAYVSYQPAQSPASYPPLVWLLGLLPASPVGCLALPRPPTLPPTPPPHPPYPDQNSTKFFQNCRALPGS